MHVLVYIFDAALIAVILIPNYADKSVLLE